MTPASFAAQAGIGVAMGYGGGWAEHALGNSSRTVAMGVYMRAALRVGPRVAYPVGLCLVDFGQRRIRLRGQAGQQELVARRIQATGRAGIERQFGHRTARALVAQKLVNERQRNRKAGRYLICFGPDSAHAATTYSHKSREYAFLPADTAK